jgi:hypothetical protein
MPSGEPDHAEVAPIQRGDDVSAELAGEHDVYRIC